MPADGDYVFRALEAGDLAMVGDWLRAPDIVRWWGDPERSIEEIRQAMDDISVEPLIVEWGDRPIAYLQAYDPHLEDDHPYQDQPFGAMGLDLTIGDPALVGQGHGSAIARQFSDLLFDEGAPRVVVDPAAGNAQAMRAYEKAGFLPLGPRTSVYGEVILMARNNPNEA